MFQFLVCFIFQGVFLFFFFFPGADQQKLKLEQTFAICVLSFKIMLSFLIKYISAFACGSALDL